MEGFNVDMLFNLQYVGHNTFSFWVWIIASTANIFYVYTVYTLVSDKNAKGNTY